MNHFLSIVLLSAVGFSRIGSAQTYTTRFEAAETPLSENGRWTNNGVDWTNIRTRGGLAYGTQTGTNSGPARFNDSYAHLSGFSPDQEAWGQAEVANPNAPCIQELEILLRWTSSPHRTTGYECFARCVSGGASYVQIVRWDGPLGKFTYLADRRGTNYGLKAGDTLKASVVGNVIAVYVNGVEKARVTDDTFKTGDPGIGEYLACEGGRGVGSNPDFGFSSFTARGLGGAEANSPLREQPLAVTSKGSPRFSETTEGKDWLARWEKNITGDSRNRYCDKETGEELGWLVSPFLNGCYYGYLATHDPKWIELLTDWTDSCIRRGIREPDGFVGWPKGDGGGGESKEYSADSLLGEAMMLRPVVLAAATILKDPALSEKYGGKARGYLGFADKIFEKWDSRDCWREVKGGGVWVVPAFGIDRETGQWSAGYADRKTTGLTNPDNKENHIARWMVAMHDATKKPVYRERAEKWFRVMKSRLKTREDGKYLVWDYWEPAGPWDYKANGATKHWVGVHPNGGYYGIDVEAIVGAYERGLVFTKADISRLIATNRDFMWNQSTENAKFQRIDGGQTDARWRNSPGVLWAALVPYDETLRKIFIANHNPSDWGGLSATPWFLVGPDTVRADVESKP